jgi:ATP-dependent helicase/nuclease subunit A
MSSRPPVADAGAREVAVMAAHSVLVQAPAGSGKTTLLTQRYLRLLARVERVENILALTFTRRAAQEMRERVLMALRTAGGGDAPATDPTTRELARAARAHLDALGVNLELQPARLRIETIDAFNAWVAAQLPVGAGTGSSPKVLSDARPCYEEAARRALSHEQDDEFGAAVEAVLALDDQRWGALLALIANMLPHRDRWLPLLAGRLQAATTALDAEQLARVRRHFDEDLQVLVARVLANAAELLGTERLEALAAVARTAARNLGRSKPLMAAWLEVDGPQRIEAGDFARWRCVADLMLTKEGRFRARFTVGEGFPPGCAEKGVISALAAELQGEPRALDVLAEIRTLPAPAYSDAQWRRVRDVAQVLVLSAAQLQAVFRDQGAVDFPAVSMAALRALGSADEPTDLGLRLDYRIQHILVDEFQDTSSAQLQLLRQLTAGWQPDDGRTVFCVGDPMQSIYGFRQAEVRAFLELADGGLGAVQFDVQRLTSNFRSARAVVEWNNASFARILPQRDDKQRGAIAFRSSLAALPDGAAAEARTEMLGFARSRDEAAAIAAMIAEATAAHPEWRVAVLVRAKSHARAVAVALRERGVAFRAVDIEPTQDRNVVRDILVLAGALLHIGDRVSWLALLRTPWVGLTLADLWCIARGSDLVWEALHDPAVIVRLSEDGQRRCARAVQVLEAAMRVRDQMSVARWVESTWLGLGGASSLANADELELAHLALVRLRDIEAQGLPDVTELPARFGNLFLTHVAAAQVEIMTIHKAKGLEFDLVVLPALQRKTPPQLGQLLLTHEFARADRDGLVMAARAPVGAEADALFDFLRRQLRDASHLEAQRLLYVACTRAKTRLVLTATLDFLRQDAGEGGDPDGEPPRLPPAGSLLRVLWPVAGASMLDTSCAPAGDADDDAPRGGALWRLPAQWSLPSDTQPSARIELPPAQREALPLFDWAGETARRVGSLVHAELQILDPAQASAASIVQRAAHYRRWLTLRGVPPPRLDDAVRRVSAALTAVLEDPKGRWILERDRRDDLREHALSAAVGGELVHAVFDRSFVADGLRWVVDYKTSQHTGGGLEAFLQNEVERYRPQLQRYAVLARLLGPEPVRVGLYFPLMRAWREWEPF